MRKRGEERGENPQTPGLSPSLCFAALTRHRHQRTAKRNLAGHPWARCPHRGVNGFAAACCPCPRGVQQAGCRQGAGRVQAGSCRHFEASEIQTLRFDTQPSANQRELFTCHPLPPPIGWRRCGREPAPGPMGRRCRRWVNDAAVQGRVSHGSWPAASMETRSEQGKQLSNAKMMTFNPEMLASPARLILNPFQLLLEASGRHRLPVPSGFFFGGVFFLSELDDVPCNDDCVTVFTTLRTTQ